MANRTDAKKHTSLRRKQRLSRRQLLHQQLERRELLAGDAGPRLISVNPNAEEIFAPQQTNPLSVRPTELTFRFGGTADLDPATLDGIRITRAGGDGQLGDANDVVIQPGYVGFGETNRVVVARFAEALPDDLFQIDIFAEDGSGTVALRDVNGDAFQPSDPNANRESLFFDLELGARVVGVVPQPVVGSGASRIQLTKQVHVYFDDPDLFEGPNGPDPTLTDPTYYKLIHTSDTVGTGDDVEFTPESVTFDADAKRVELHFAADLHALPGLPATLGSFRLRVGTSEEVAPPLETPAGIPANPAPTVSGAANLGTLENRRAMLIKGKAISGPGLPFDYPGAIDEPGHRQNQDENHYTSVADFTSSLTTRTYTVRNGAFYGTNSAGQDLFSDINPDQQQRVREAFEFFGEQLGIDFIEVDAEDADYKVAVGDMSAVVGVSGPGGVGVAAQYLANPTGPFVPLLTVLDGSEEWDDSYGGDFIHGVMQGIGTMLGLGQAHDLPDGTIKAEGGGDSRLGPAAPEWVFLGDNDILHGQYLFRPDNRDVDMYRFTVPAGEAGSVAIETQAERLTNSSNLNTHLTLYRQTAAGPVKVASNDDAFGNDSFLQVDLEEGEYFIAVTARGNEDFDPTNGDTGSGGASQGAYDLRVEFRSANASTIVDTRGTALDGDGDGKAGGAFNFWFKANDPALTRFVDPSAPDGGNGSLASPFRTIPQAINGISSGQIIRLLPSAGLDGNLDTLADNRAYEIGQNSLNQALADGSNLVVPAGVTVMVDAGAILKMRQSRIAVGSGAGGIDASLGAFQVLGTPDSPVRFTSYNDASIGINTNSLDNTPDVGDWGGIQFRNDVDRGQGRKDLERQGIFLNYVAGADLRYGGGQVRINNQFQTVAPIDVTAARPTLLHNTITASNSAAISADPASFEETTFTEPRYQRFEQFVPDYTRVGPQIYGNTLTDNSINGLFVRIDSDAFGTLRQLEVPGRFANTEIVHVLGENLLIRGNPGGSLRDASLPGLDLVAVTPQPGTGTLAAGSYEYKVSFVDAHGNETAPSTATTSATLGVAGRITLSGLPVATGDFVARRVYRSRNGLPFEFIADLNRSQQTLVDNGLAANPALRPLIGQIARPRLDARLTIDPGIILKSSGVRIHTGFGADLIAEGVEGRPVVMTSRSDDRYGAGGSFNTNNTNSFSSGTAGDWAGIYASPFSTVSLDYAVVAYAGGDAGVAGTNVGFNALELHQAHARVAHSVFEFNASGVVPGQGTRQSLGPNEAAVIYVAGAQPVIVENVFRNNNSASNTAMISIDANALNTTPVDDFGRQTGVSDPVDHPPGNLGPLVRGNAIGNAGIGGMRIRGGTLTTETVWDDTDIAHVLEESILVPDFHTYGGLRLQSRPDESLVAKFGTDAALTADGRPLDIEDRIGGRIQVLGAPGFPVIMTSLADDSVGAGFGPLGLPFRDTNGDGPSVGTPGDWQGIQLNEFSHDRNVATVTELEGRIGGAGDLNSIPGTSQFLAALSPRENSGDENLRLGATVHGTIADPGDTDVYSFRGTAGTLVWIDLDRTGSGLDSVLELINSNGDVLARSDNSHAEDAAGALDDVDTDVFPSGHAMPMRLSPFAPLNRNGTYRDLHSLNPLDAAMRVVLPGVTGEEDEYFVRVTGADGTTGVYQLQLRLRETDEFAGSTVQFASIHYAETGIETRGLPSHSLLTGEASVSASSPTTAINLGNLFSSDRSAISVAGQFQNPSDINILRFSIERDSIRTSGNGRYSTVTFDVDYADGFGRPDTTAWLYRINGGNRQLVMIGTDSNVGSDRAAPQSGTDVGDLARGSAGSRDAFIGTVDLLAGDYELVITNNSVLDSQIYGQYHTANPSNPGIRLQPNDSVVRVAEDRNFDGTTGPLTTDVGPKQVAFSGQQNSVPFALGDVTLFITGRYSGDATTRSRLHMNNPYLGDREAVIGNDFTRVGSIAMDPRGRLVGFVAPPEQETANATDANTQGFLLLDDGVTYGSFSTIGGHGLSTFEAHLNTATPPAPVLGAPVGTGTTRNGDGMIVNALAFRIDSGNQSQNRLYGVAGRGNGTDNFDRPILNSDGNVVGIEDNTSSDSTTSHLRNAQNILYRFNPDTGAVINASSNGASRAGNEQGYGAGTNGVEVGYLQTSAGDVQGNVTGMTFIGSTMYAVTTEGELLRLNSVPPTNPDPDTPTYLLTSSDLIKTSADPILDPVTNQKITFSGLTTGPKTVEGGKYANMLFATASNGNLYALNTAGELQPVFAAGQSRIATGVISPTDLDFSNLDVNLWGVTDQRRGDAGHGIVPTPTLTRHITTEGGNSLHFGFTDRQGGDVRARTWDAGDDPGPRSNGSYNFAGGAKGTIESHSIDLSEYSIEDQPMLYFNYFLDAENSSALINADSQMRDSLRVYAAGDDGDWRLVATNNLAGFDSNFSRGAGDDDADEFDEIESGYIDANGKYHFVQKLFNESEWRQARISMAPFAGSSNVKIRVEFSSAGEPDRDVVELRGLPGDQLVASDFFEVTGATNIQQRFEFDHGLVLALPSGAALSSGDAIEVGGKTVTFVNGPAGPGQIQIVPSDTAEQVANRLQSALLSAGVTPVLRSADHPSWINIPSVPSSWSVSGALANPNVLIEKPGTFPNTPVPVDISMSAAEVRDAIRIALAAELNAPGQGTNVDVFPIYGDSVRIFGGTINDPGPLPFIGSQNGGSALPGARSGVNLASNEQNYSGDALDRLRVAGTRAQNNTGEGVYIDDIIIGFAERGEMVTGFTQGAASRTANPQFQPTVPGSDPLLEVTTGRFQVEIRSSEEYAAKSDGSPRNIPFHSFDTNDVIGEQLGIEVTGDGSVIRDGQSFTLSDGVEVVRFEFEDLGIANGLPRKGVTSGSIAVGFRGGMSAAEVATEIRKAINSPAVRNRIDVVAASPSGESSGAQNSSRLVLHGNVAVGRRGETNFGLSFMESIRWGTTAGTETGDRNRVREQGQVILANNVISDSSIVGIHLDAGRRDRSGASDIVGPLASTQLPRPGSPINFPTLNADRLAPGVVVVNNVLISNVAGGIEISGDPIIASQGSGPIPFARVINNTIVGSGRSNDFGIRVETNASPTLVNNAIIDQTTGVQVTSGSTVQLSGTLYAGNSSNSPNVGLGSNALTVGNGTPLFVDSAGRNFIPAPGSPLIDSSIEFTADRLNLSSLREALGIRQSPILAPERDMTGQLRSNDTTVGGGTGANVFIDRGAIDRSDLVGPVAELVQPLDNAPDGSDADAGNSFVRLVEGPQSYFEIKLVDPVGNGPNPDTITADAVIVTENGRRLVAGADYEFGFNSSTNVIRLTPKSNVWKPAAAYEITLNNRDRQVLTVPTGDRISDGDQVVITDVANQSATLEFDTGFVLTIPAAGVVDGDRLIYTSQNRIRRIEWVEQGTTRTPLANSSIQLSFSASDTPDVLAGKLAQALRDLEQGLEAARAIEGGRVYIGGRAGDTLEFEGSAPLVEGTPGVSDGAIAVPMIPSVLINQDVVAGQLVAAISRARSEMSPALLSGAFTPGGGSVWLERTTSVTGLPAGSDWSVVLTQPIRDLAGNVLQPNRASGETRFTILMPGVELDFGDAPFDTLLGQNGAQHVLGDLALPRLGSLVDVEGDGAPGSSDDQTPLPSVAIAASGSTTLVEYVTGANPSQGSLVFGGVGFDPVNDTFAPADGDTITITVGSRSVTFELTTSPGVGAGNIAVAFDPLTVTRQSLAASLAAAIHNQTWPIADAVVDPVEGQTVHLDVDDEEGVGVGAIQVDGAPAVEGLFVTQSGEFLSFLNPLDGFAEASVFVTGSGLLDAWIDYNQDGDWDDIGEQVLTNALVLDGDNRLQLPVPTDAVEGLTWARFRLSPTGNQLPDGVSIGGEVEDFQVRVVSLTPPTLEDDAYDVDEDTPLAVDASAGVLLGVGADTYTGLDDVRAVIDDSPLFGEIVLNEDGSFAYTPNDNFYGTDVFTYRILATRELVPGVPGFGILPVRSADVGTVTITVNPVNDAPTAENKAFTALEDNGTGAPILTVTAAELLANAEQGDFAGFPIAPDAPWNEQDQTLRISALTIGGTTLAPAGQDDETLTASTPQGSLVTARFSAGALVDLTYQPTGNYNRQNPFSAADGIDPATTPLFDAIDAGDLLDSFTFTVTDDGFTRFPDGLGPDDGNGGFLTQTSEPEESTVRTAFIRVDPVNDPPEVAGPATIEVLEDAGAVAVAWADFIRSGPINALDELPQSVSLEITNIAADVSGLFAVAPSIDDSGTITFTAASNAVGFAVLTIVATDDGPADAAIGDDAEADAIQVTLSIRPVNDAPVLAPEVDPSEPATYFLFEDNDSADPGQAGQPLFIPATRAASTDLPGLLDQFVVGPNNEADGTLGGSQSLRISEFDSLGNAVFPITTTAGGTITAVYDEDDPTRIIGVEYVPPADFNGQDSFTYSVVDNGQTWDLATPVTGSEPAYAFDEGAIDADPLVSEFQMRLEVASVNDAPQFDAQGDVEVYEDRGEFDVPPVDSANVGLTVIPNWAFNILAGPPTATDENDPVTGQSVSFVVTVTGGADPAELFVADGNGNYVTVDDDGTLRFQTLRHRTGSVTFEVVAVDDGPFSPPNINTSAPLEFTIDVLPVNDAPEFGGPDLVRSLEDSGAVDVQWTESLRPGPVEATDEAGQVVTFTVTQIDTNNPDLFEVAPAIDSSGRLTYTPAAHQVGAAVFMIVGTDNGPNNDPTDINDDPVSDPVYVTIAIDSVNDAPEFDGPATVTVLEDAGDVVIDWATHVRPGPAVALDEFGNLPELNGLFGDAELENVTFTIAPAPGHEAEAARIFETQPQLSSFLAADDTGGELTFRPALHQNGTAVFVITATDNGTSWSSGDPAGLQADARTTTFTLTLTVEAVNDAPEFGGTDELEVLEDSGSHTIDWADFIRSGPLLAADELSGDADSAAQTVTLAIAPDPASAFPADLFVGGAAGVTIDANGRISFTPAVDAVGSAVFVVTATDDGVLDSSRGDVNFSQQTLTIHVRPVNDAPRVTASEAAEYRLLEDQTLLIPLYSSGPGEPAGLLDPFTVGPANEADSTTPGGNQSLAVVDFAPTRTLYGTIETVLDGDNKVIALRYRPDTDFNSGADGSMLDTFFYTVTDDGVTFSFNTSSEESDPLTSEFTIDLRVEPVNDAPSFTPGASLITRLEDGGPISIPAWATDIVAGPQAAIDETDPVNGQTVTFDVVPAAGYTAADLAALFSVAPAISTDGTLTFTPAANAVGTVVVQVTADDGGDGAETGRGDENFSESVLLTLTLAPVNDPPVANPSVLQLTLDEDGSIDLPIHNLEGTGLYDIFRVGPANEADGTPGGNQTLSTDEFFFSPTTPHGNLVAYSIDGVFAGLRYIPDPNFNGTDSFVFGVVDDGQSFNLTSGQMEDDSRGSYATVSLTIHAVNDRPQFAGAADVSVSEDSTTTSSDGTAGLTVIPNWVTNVLAGPVTALDENGGVTAQNLTFVITPVSGTDSNVLFAELPTVDPVTGELRFRTAADINGRTVFQIIAQDNGPQGHLDGDSSRPENQYQSLSRQFAIEVTAENDPPTFTAGGDITLLEDNGPYNRLWATNISPGPADEVASGQAVMFDVSVAPADQAKFSSLPTISDNGLLQFTPAPNASGNVDILITARDTAGGQAPQPVTLSLTITPTNDAPVAFDDAFTTNEDTVLTLSTASLLNNDQDADFPQEQLRVSGLPTTSLLGATITPSADGLTITYDPRNAAAIQALRPGQLPATDVFTYQAVDQAGVPSTRATVTLTINGINDAPIARPDAPILHPTNSTTFFPLSNDTDIDGTIDPSSVVITLQPAFGTLDISSSGAFTYTPSATFQGSDLIRYAVRDDQGMLSQTVEIRLGVNHPPVAVNDSFSTYRNSEVTFSVLANDRDNDGTLDPSTVEILSGPAHGQTIIHADGTITYVPTAEYAGNDSFTYQVLDDDGAPSNVATVSLRVLASTLQNPDNPLDVDDSGEISPIDALLIINYLNRGGSSEIDPDRSAPPYFDVDGNGQIGPLDALQVINSLNRAVSSGEGEGSAATPFLGESNGSTSDAFQRIDSPETVNAPNSPAAPEWDFGQIGELDDDRLDDLLEEIARRRDDSTQDEADSLDAVWESFGSRLG